MHGSFSNSSSSEDEIGRILDRRQYQDDEVQTEAQLSPSTKAQITKFSSLVYIIPGIIMICMVAVVSIKYSNNSSTSSASAKVFTGPTPTYTFGTMPKAVDYVFKSSLSSINATNEYGQYKGPYPWFDDFPGSQLIEPYKKSTITAVGSTDEIASYMWEIEGQEGTFQGNPITVQFNTTGIYTLTVHGYDAADTYVSSYSTYLISKYVKREIRSLTDEDREKFLDATSAIWTLSETEGQALYGENFTAIHTFVREHAIASGDIMCDQFHEGTGFLTHHLALSNSFEASMRAVDPTVTLHYWDFTQEGQIVLESGKHPSHLLEVTPVFSDKWFGAVENNLIVNSRWAGVKMPMVEEGDEENTPHNSYGYIRSYWNNNNESLITRHMFDACGTEPTYKQVPTCQMHYDVLNVKTLGDFQDLSPGDGHGPMHVQIGGMYGGCTDAMAVFEAKWGAFMDYNMTEDEITATGQSSKSFINKWGTSAQRRAMYNKAIVGEYFHIYRGFWRSHMCAIDNAPALLECPEKCDVDLPFEECTCKMPALTSGEMDWTNLTPCLLNSEDNQEYFNKTMSVEYMRDLTYAIATSSVKEGEMLEAASPADPMFWMIHTVIERLLAAKRLSTVTSMGGAQFNKWTGQVGKAPSSWRDSSYYDLKKGQNNWYPAAYDCYGHAYDEQVLPDDLKFTPHMSGVADSDGDGVVTNWEFYQALDPNDIYLNDYVFDHFEWDHCEGAIEEDMSSAYGSMSGWRQDTFTFRQVTLLMSLVLVVVMLFTCIQFAVHRRGGGKYITSDLETKPLTSMATSGVSYSTHEYYMRGTPATGGYEAVR